MFKETSKELLDFIGRSYSSFHLVYNMKEELNRNGFEEIFEQDRWNLKAGGKYYVARNESSIIAFKIPGGDLLLFRATVIFPHLS